MKIKASPENIREMKKNINKTVNEINIIVKTINQVLSHEHNWNDDKAHNFKQIMMDIARLTQAPNESLISAIPKLDKLAFSLEEYNKVRFK